MDSDYNNLIGQKFDMVTVIEKMPSLPMGHKGKTVGYWKCICDCQQDIENPQFCYKTTQQLKQNKHCNCGCIEFSRVRDLTGQKFGRLTVIDRAEDYIQSNGKKRINWKCICDCQQGKINPIYTYVTRDRLVSGNTQSCGCIKQEYYDAKNKNSFELKNNYYIGYTNSGDQFYFDIDQYEKVKKYCWFINKEGYIIASDKERNKQIWLHRLVMDVIDIDYNEIMVDHIGGKETRYDNRKQNLRLVNRYQNGQNIGIRKNNRSGITGVCLDERTNVYSAYICVNGQNITLGRTKQFDEAVKMRKEAEEKYFGEYSYNNSQKITT